MSITRRSFFVSAAAAAYGQSKVPVMGSGAHTYEAYHDWPQLPSTHQFGNTHGIVMDRQGRVVVAHTVHKNSASPDAIAIFDPDGKFVKSWGADLRGGAHGLTIRQEGGVEYLYHCDNVKGHVRKTTLDGELVWTIHAPVMSGVYAKASEYRPSNLAVAPNGDIYIADGYGKFGIHQYDAKTNYIRTFGGTRHLMDANKDKETGPGTTIWPHAIGIDTRSGTPLLMVGERGSNSRIQYFDLNGRSLHMVKDGVRWPSTFDFLGDTLLMPDLKAVVTLFDKQNKPIAQLGDGRQADGKTYESLRAGDRAAFTPARFVAPHAACFAPNGDIYVAEWVEVGRVTKLKRS